MQEIEKKIRELKDLVSEVPDRVRKMAALELEAKPKSMKWSKKEILGHLVDSAFNNVQRLIRVQYEPGVKIVYDQDEWVKINKYQSQRIDQVINRWILMNAEFINLVETFPEAKLEDTIDTGKGGVELCTARFLITDYLAHMKHHLNQVFN